MGLDSGPEFSVRKHFLGRFLDVQKIQGPYISDISVRVPLFIQSCTAHDFDAFLYLTRFPRGDSTLGPNGVPCKDMPGGWISEFCLASAVTCEYFINVGDNVPISHHGTSVVNRAETRSAVLIVESISWYSSSPRVF